MTGEMRRHRSISTLRLRRDMARNAFCPKRSHNSHSMFRTDLCRVRSVSTEDSPSLNTSLPLRYREIRCCYAAVSERHDQGEFHSRLKHPVLIICTKDLEFTAVGNREIQFIIAAVQ